MPMNLPDLGNMLATRRIVALTVYPPDTDWHSDKLWTVAVRTEGSAWHHAKGPSYEAAVGAVLAALGPPTTKTATRYFKVGGGLLVTYNGTEPLRSEGGFQEMTGREYVTIRDEMIRAAAAPADDDWDAPSPAAEVVDDLDAMFE